MGPELSFSTQLNSTHRFSVGLAGRLDAPALLVNLTAHHVQLGEVAEHPEPVLDELERAVQLAEGPLELGRLHQDARRRGRRPGLEQELSCPVELVVLALQLHGGQPDVLRVRVRTERP